MSCLPLALVCQWLICETSWCLPIQGNASWVLGRKWKRLLFKKSVRTGKIGKLLPAIMTKWLNQIGCWVRMRRKHMDHGQAHWNMWMTPWQMENTYISTIVSGWVYGKPGPCFTSPIHCITSSIHCFDSHICAFTLPIGCIHSWYFREGLWPEFS